MPGCVAIAHSAVVAYEPSTTKQHNCRSQQVRSMRRQRAALSAILTPQTTLLPAALARPGMTRSRSLCPPPAAAAAPPPAPRPPACQARMHIAVLSRIRQGLRRCRSPAIKACKCSCAGCSACKQNKQTSRTVSRLMARPGSLSRPNSVSSPDVTRRPTSAAASLLRPPGRTIVQRRPERRR